MNNQIHNQSIIDQFMTWRVGDILSLPFPDASFSLVVARYSFHHLLDPGAALAEMMRVCKPGGRVMVMDAAPESDKTDAYNRMEKLRDPSHVRAMPAEELLTMAREAGLVDVKTAFCKVEFELENALAASFPNPGAEEKLRRIFLSDLVTDTLGWGRTGGARRFTFTIRQSLLSAQNLSRNHLSLAPRAHARHRNYLR
jgi:SAM-dependent methyltransferase